MVTKLTAEELNNGARYALPCELDYIRELAPFCETAVMLGAGPGVFALAYFEGNPAGFMYIIDNKTYDYTLKHLDGAGISKLRFYPVLKNSWDTEFFIARGVVDLLIIDADHTYESVMKDVAAWYPYLRPGSYIFFHDYLERRNGFNGTDEWAKGGVAQAVDELFPEVIQVGISAVKRVA